MNRILHRRPVLIGAGTLTIAALIAAVVLAFSGSSTPAPASAQSVPAHAYKQVGCLMSIQNDITALQYENVRDLIYLNASPLNLLFLNPAGQRVQSTGVPWVALQNACSDVHIVRVGPLVRGYHCLSGACQVIDSSTLATAREKTAVKPAH